MFRQCFTIRLLVENSSNYRVASNWLIYLPFQVHPSFDLATDDLVLIDLYRPGRILYRHLGNLLFFLNSFAFVLTIYGNSKIKVRLLNFNSVYSHTETVNSFKISIHNEISSVFYFSLLLIPAGQLYPELRSLFKCFCCISLGQLKVLPYPRLSPTLLYVH